MYDNPIIFPIRHICRSSRAMPKVHIIISRPLVQAAKWVAVFTGRQDRSTLFTTVYLIQSDCGSSSFLLVHGRS